MANGVITQIREVQGAIAETDSGIQSLGKSISGLTGGKFVAGWSRLGLPFSNMMFKIRGAQDALGAFFKSGEAGRKEQVKQLGAIKGLVDQHGKLTDLQETLTKTRADSITLGEGELGILAMLHGKQEALNKVQEMAVGAKSKLNKETLKQLGGHKKLLKGLEANKKEMDAGTTSMEEYVKHRKFLQELGVVDEEGLSTKRFGAKVSKRIGQVKAAGAKAAAPFIAMKAFMKMDKDMKKTILSRKAKNFWSKITGFLNVAGKFFLMSLYYIVMIGIAIVVTVAIVKKLWPLIKKAWTGLKKLWPAIKDALMPIWDAIKNFFGVLFDPNSNIWQMFGAYFKMIIAIVVGLWKVGKIILVAIWDSFKTWAIRKKDELWDSFKTWAGGVWLGLEEKFPILKTIRDSLTELVLLFVEKWGKLKEKVEPITKAKAKMEEHTGKIPWWMMASPTLVAGKIASNKIQGMQSGGIVGNGGAFMVGERGPELVNLPRGSAVTPNGGGNTIHVHVSGRVGASDSEIRDIAQKVGQMVSREINRTTSSAVRM